MQVASAEAKDRGQIHAIDQVFGVQESVRALAATDDPELVDSKPEPRGPAE
jgi:hypothetical protein